MALNSHIRASPQLRAERFASHRHFAPELGIIPKNIKTQYFWLRPSTVAFGFDPSAQEDETITQRTRPTEVVHRNVFSRKEHSCQRLDFFPKEPRQTKQPSRAFGRNQHLIHKTRLMTTSISKDLVSIQDCPRKAVSV